MLTWMRHHHKTIMFGTVLLVVPSFILLYGYDQIQRDPEAQTVAKVYGERVLEDAYSRMRQTVSDNYRQAGREVDGDALRNDALDAIIKRQIQKQKAAEMGIATTNEQLAQNIHDYFKGLSQDGTFDVRAYQSVLLRSGMTPAMYEASHRESMTFAKLQNALSVASFPSEQEKQAAIERRGDKAYVELLTFQASSFTEDVDVDEADLESFFKEKIEDYRIPEKRRIRYLEFVPAEFRDQVESRVNERRLEKFFNPKQQEYQVGDQRALECIVYKSTNFESQVEVTDEALEAFLEENQTRYRTREERKVKYVAIPYTALVSDANLTEESVRAAYDARKSDFTHDEQVHARHILLRVDGNEDEVVAKAESILEEIRGGRDFAEAAREYSEGPTQSRGGDLDYFGRGQMVPEFEDAAFNTEIGGVTGPVKTQFGYHLIKVEDHRQAGTDPLEDVRDDVIAALIAEEGREAAQARFAALPQALEDISEAGPILYTDWFQRGGQIEGIASRDLFRFSAVAFNAKAGQTGDLVLGEKAVYLLQPTEIREPADQTLAEVRSRVERDYRQDRAKSFALEAAKQDKEQLDSAQQTWEALAEIRGVTVETGLFEQTARTVPGLSGNAYSIVSQAFMMEQGQIQGPVELQTETVLFKMVGSRDAYIPTLDEVRGKVTADYIEFRQGELAAQAAGRLSETIALQSLSLQDAAAGAGLTTLETEPFDKEGMIPGMGRKPEVAEAAFELEKGGVSGVIESKRTTYGTGYQQEQVLDRYYLLEVTEIIPDHLPEFAEVKDDVESDYRLFLAKDVAEEKAENAENAIAKRLVSATPFSATQTLDFETLADELEGSFSRPTSALSRDSSQIPGVGSAFAAARSVLEMTTGEITPAIPIYEWKPGEGGRLEKGDVKAYVIAQVVGRQTPDAGMTDEEKRQVEQFQMMNNMYRSQLAYGAWVEEASRVAFNRGDVEIRYEYFAPPSDTIDEKDESSETEPVGGSDSSE